jgi:hypothetical protein
MDEIIDPFEVSHSADEIGVSYGSSASLCMESNRGAIQYLFGRCRVCNALEDSLTATEPKLYAVGRIVLQSFSKSERKESASKSSIMIDFPSISMSLSSRGE